jgi:hypothetical protein
MSFDLVEFDLAARALCYELDSNDPGHNQSVDVSYFAQTPDGQRRNRNTKSIRHRKAFGLHFNLLNRNPSGCPCPRSETCRAKGNTMQVPAILQGESLKRLLQGAAAGAVATMFVGFYWGGWSLSSTADKMAKGRSELAVVAALAPVCADKFRALPDAEAKQVALSKVDSWKRRDEFPKEFVTLPGESYPSSALVDACYTLLLAPKSAALN